MICSTKLIKDIMFFHFLLLMTCSVSFLHGSHVSSCDENCADKPVFTPSQLVVKYGGSTSAMCSVCQRACLNRQSGIEVSAGRMRQNGTMILWQVKRLTVWDIDAVCYYNMDDKQCCSKLPVTLYKPPDNVSISFVGHALECIVRNVAPVKNLTVTFYRGQTALDQLFNSNTNKEPMIAIFTLDITTSKKGTGGQYWCEAKLDLGPEGPQPPPVMISQNITVAMERMLRRWDDSQKYLSDNPHLVCEETANCLVVFCIDFEIDEKHALMEQVAHQAIVMKFILDLAGTLVVDPRGCFRQFFSKIKTADKLYQEAFDHELEMLKERVRSCARIRMESAMKELEEEEKQKRLGPGGLDPVEVYESLPKERQKSFDEKNVQMLQEAINKLDPEEGKYHLRRCIDSGLWVPDPGEEEEEEDDED